MIETRMKRRLAAALAVAACAAAPALAQRTAEAPALGRLEKGLWQVRIVGARQVAPRPICLGDRAMLAQLRHRDYRCTRTVSASTPNSVTINYECAGVASGMSTVRVETSRLARIESQGIDNGLPFAFRAEARRVGTCR